MIVNFWPRYNLWLEDMRRSRKTDGGSGPRGSEGPAVWPNNGMTSLGAAGAAFIGRDGTAVYDHCD